jgi:Flp pilus assembly protein TadD
MQTVATSIREINTALQQGHPVEAEKLARTYLVRLPTDANALQLLAMSLHAQGRKAETVQTFHSLTQLSPNIPQYWNNLATALRNADDQAGAKAAYRTATTLDPRFYEALMNLGYLSIDMGDYPCARDSFLQAHTATPASPDARIYAAVMCAALANDEAVERLLVGWQEWKTLSDDVALELAIVLSHAGKGDDGMQILERLTQTNPNNRRATAHLVMWLERVNRLDEARALLERLPQPGADGDARVCQEVISAHATLALREKDPSRAHVLLQQMIVAQDTASARFGTGSLDVWRQGNLYFLLARACDQRNDSDAVMTALHTAHALEIERARQVMPALVDPQAPAFRATTKPLTAHMRGAWPNHPAPPASQSPIFIVGFPRSGTTMLEQMLDAHPDLRAMDERPFVGRLIESVRGLGLQYPEDLDKLDHNQCEALREQYWALTEQVAPRREGQRRVDKNPLNMLRLPMINRLFPNSPIILMVRHPCDVILSNYMQHFRVSEFAVLCSSLDRLARGYVTAFDSWLHHVQLLKPNVMELRYEDLLDDFTGKVRLIGDFLELDDTTSLTCYDTYARDKGFISTPSYSKVIEPPNKSAVDRWRRYCAYFEPLMPILQPIIQRWRYSV